MSVTMKEKKGEMMKTAPVHSERERNRGIHNQWIYMKDALLFIAQFLQLVCRFEIYFKSIKIFS